MIASDEVVKEAAEYLMRHDEVLGRVIEREGLCTIRPHKDYYRELVESIISQQLSVKAAASIGKKFVDLFGGEFPEPAAILTKSPEDLRGVGLSWAKAAYVQDLARHVVEGKVRFDHLDSLTNDEVVAELTAVKGIGEWSAHMFLMWCMGRTDVLAVGDLGIRNGIRELYGLDHQPKADEIAEIAARGRWHPFESVACWYVWQSLDNAPK